MRFLFLIPVLTVSAAGLFSAGCAAQPKTAKTHIMYLPEQTGSHLRRAVVVDESGNPVTGANDSAVRTTGGESLRKAQDIGTGSNRGG